VTDEACYYLNHRWPARYTLNSAGTLKTRDRQIVECENVWRKANGLPELPLPADNRPRLASTDANQVTAINWARNGIQPDAALAAQFEDLKGKSLAIAPIIDIVKGYATQPIAGTGGLDIGIRRDEDLKGVSISVRLLAGNAQATTTKWSEFQTYTVGTNRGGSESGGFNSYPNWQAGNITMGARAAAAASAETPYYIKFAVTANKP
jgi:hypothetical protein